MNNSGKTSTGLLLVAHGSRKSASNAEILALAAKLKSKNATFDWLDAAFIELAEPDVTTSIAQACNAGVTELTVFPHFLAAGYHVQVDLPGMIEDARQAHPELTIHLMPHLGTSDALADLIMELTSHQAAS